MNETSINQESKKKEIEIYPLGKWKRILVYLCDLVFCLFAGFLIMNALAMPIGKASSNYYERVENAEVMGNHRDDILFGNGLLYSGIDQDKYDFDAVFNMTSTLYMRHFVEYDDPNFAKYDVIKNYYIDIRNNKDEYTRIMQEVDKDYGFFEFKEGMPQLKKDYKDQFRDGLAPNKYEDMSDIGKKNYTLFRDNIFVSAYHHVYDDIMKNDLTFDGYSFIECQKEVEAGTRYIDVLLISATYISMFLSGIILFLIVPLSNKNGKTISMMMMKIERVGVKNINLLRKSQVAIFSVYQIVSCLGCLLFLPLPNVAISYVFRLGSIFFMAMLAAALVLVSFIVLMFNHYNRSLFDVLSQTVMITSDSLDEIYRSKGYDI